MPVEFIKATLGYREVKSNKEMATHMLYTLEEHEEKNETIRELKKQIEELIKNCDYEVRKANKEACDQIETAETNAKIAISEIQIKLDEANNKIKHLDNINLNFIRISKERANAKRGLIPKKKHSGYLVLNIDESTYSHKDSTVKHPTTESYPYWRVRLQTPYLATIDIDATRDLIYADLKSKIGHRMGIKSVVEFYYINNCSRKEIKELWEIKNNFIFKQILKMNAVKGFWEIEYWTRYIITVVPEMLTSTD